MKQQTNYTVMLLCAVCGTPMQLLDFTTARLFAC